MVINSLQGRQTNTRIREDYLGQQRTAHHKPQRERECGNIWQNSITCSIHRHNTSLLQTLRLSHQDVILAFRIPSIQPEIEAMTIVRTGKMAYWAALKMKSILHPGCVLSTSYPS